MTDQDSKQSVFGTIAKPVIPNVPTASGAWSCAVAQGLHETLKKSHEQALGTPAFVTRIERPNLDAKDLEKLVKGMLTPFPLDKFDTVNKVSSTTLDIDRIQSSASVAHMLTKVSSHFTSYDLGLAFTKFPVVDFTGSLPTWDLRTTINLFESYDLVSPEIASKTVQFMRERMLDDELPKELTWTHEFLLSCCESASGENSLARVVRGETDSIMSTNDLMFGGPLTLILILKHISSSSEQAINNLKKSVPNINISTIPGENINQICNALSYVLRRLDTSAMPNLSMDLLKVMQTTSHPDFNKVFESWSSFVLLKIAPSPAWNAIFIRAREVYEEHADTWVTDVTNNGDSAFKAGLQGKPTDNGGSDNGRNGGGGSQVDAEWKKSPWYLFPNAATGDTCVTTDAGQKCWSKTINGKPVKWCGRCFSKKYQRRGMWTSNATQCHFTHEHVSRGASQHNANLATDRSPVEEPAPEDTARSAAVRPDTSFSEALQHAAEGN